MIPDPRRLKTTTIRNVIEFECLYSQGIVLFISLNLSLFTIIRKTIFTITNIYDEFQKLPVRDFFSI